MKKAIYYIVILLILINLFSISRLYFTSARISKVYFTPYYVAKLYPGENELDVFKNYMQQRDWEYFDRMGGLLRFKKGGKIFEITNRNIKTIIRKKK